MRTHIDSGTRGKSRRIQDLKNRTLQLERRLSDARDSLERELAIFTRVDEPGRWRPEEDSYGSADDTGDYGGPDLEPTLDQPVLDEPVLEQPVLDEPVLDQSALDEPVLDEPVLDEDGSPGYPYGEYVQPGSPDSYRGSGGYGGARTDTERTEVLVNLGRSSAYRRGTGRKVKVALVVLLVAGLSVLLAVLLSGGGGSWPASVAVMKREANEACRNPDVRSEPGQVNFACAKETRQILWVFALLTSAGSPQFRDTATGRTGLEPITPSQGGEIAWSLNLHHPYDPQNPIDSMAVAARAINNIIAGATVTGDNGHSVIQAGLEGHATNCLRYTGSAATQARQGFPRVCANPVTSPAGKAALVADVYQKWVVGATPRAAQDAAVLFENAHNPGDTTVQYIIKHLPVGTG